MMDSQRFTEHGLDIWRLRTKHWQTDILLSKGADIASLRHHAIGELLEHTKDGLALFDRRDLQKQPLQNYNELYYGGWQDLVPHRAVIDRTEIPVGHINAASIAWKPLSCVRSEHGLAAELSAQIPRLGFTLRKLVTLDDEQDEFSIIDTVHHQGIETVCFPWTHHIAFGGDLCDDETSILFPDCRLFDIKDWEKHPQDAWQSLLKPLSEAIDDNGMPYDLTHFPMTHRRIYTLLAGMKRPSIAFACREHLLRLSWQSSLFPYVRYWAQMDDSLRTVALEPSTSLFHTAEDSVRGSMVCKLEPGQQVQGKISLHYEKPPQPCQRYYEIRR